MMRKIVIPGAILLVAVLGAITLTATSSNLEPAASRPMARTVRAAIAKPTTVRLNVHSQGTVMPHTESDLIAEVAGRVIHMSPALVSGGYFKNGDVLLELDAADYQAALSRARSAFQRAQAEHEHAQFEFERHSELERRQLSSRSAMQDTQRVFKVAEAALRDSRIAVEQAERDLSRTRITAPFTGLVRGTSVDVGQFVSRGIVLARVYASESVEVRLPIADRQLAFLNLPLDQRGAIAESLRPKVQLSADYAGQHYTWQAEIVRTEAEIDLRSRMVHVVARVVNDEQTTPLAVGLYVEAEIEGRSVADVVVLPRSTLRNGNQVMVIDNEDRLRFRTIELLRLHGDDVLIQSGLQADERVVISAIQNVTDGTLVVPVLGPEPGSEPDTEQDS